MGLKMIMLLLVVASGFIACGGGVQRATTVPPNFNMVRIPAGEFVMGASAEVGLAVCKQLSINCKQERYRDEEPEHKVYVDEYFIDKYEVTNAQYAECVAAWDCTSPQKTKSYSHDSYYNNPEFANYPVIYVDWRQARSYCEFVGKRLPTEAEWEKAARGTDGRIYPWGNEFDGSRLNFCDKNCTLDWANKSYDDGYADTAPVGTYELGRSLYGVYDMSGNVFEWVGSDYKPYPYKGDDGRDDLLGDNNKVIRGGGWGANDLTRASSRSNGTQTLNYGDYLGFRCAQ